MRSPVAASSEAVRARAAVLAAALPERDRANAALAALLTTLAEVQLQGERIAAALAAAPLIGDEGKLTPLLRAQQSNAATQAQLVRVLRIGPSADRGHLARMAGEERLYRGEHNGVPIEGDFATLDPIDLDAEYERLRAAGRIPS